MSRPVEMKPKTLVFEGAGWAEADSSKASDLGNCRIRTTFINKRGETIYFEASGFPPHKSSPKYMQGFSVGGWVSHCINQTDPKDNRVGQLEGNTFEYCKQSILGLINSVEIGGEFSAIEVRNDWDGFAIDGLNRDEKENLK